MAIYDLHVRCLFTYVLNAGCIAPQWLIGALRKTGICVSETNIETCYVFVWHISNIHASTTISSDL